MECTKCGSALAPYARDFGSDQGGVNVVITGVPAGRCEDCQESFTTDATRRRMDAIADGARRQAIEQGATEVVRPWSAAVALEAAQLGDELKHLADRLAAASTTGNAEALTEALAQVSAALKTLVARAREAGIALPESAAGFAKDKPEA